MAAIARMDQEKRTVQVDREELIEALQRNREQHIRDYEEAMAGYKAALLTKVDNAFNEAGQQIEKMREKVRQRLSALTDADIPKQRDSFTIIDEIRVEMKVPRSYASEYDAAIDMAIWDVRETLELTYAEFTCFVRDQWDWKSGFEAVSMLYKASPFVGVAEER